MEIEFQKAKNGEETAVCNNILLHSSYAPSREAERFVQNLTFPFSPDIIIITEPALSYSAAFLKEKYKNCRIGAIRYCPAFNNFNFNFDFIINYYEHPDFEAYLENIFNEEILINIQFISWEPSARAFASENSIVWNCIKAALERAKTILVTRQFFEKKWLLNTIKFCQFAKKTLTLSGVIDKDAVILSSGPSLSCAISVIKELREAFFVICLSSAISACLKYDIIPDLCMSTDGGFWAGEHLKELEKYDIPLALAIEGHCSKKLLNKNRILPLVYDDGISLELAKECNLKSNHAVRNGTVSGTALLFALEYFTKDIFLCGLDMACQKGFQHIQPNELEKNSAPFDNRLSCKEKRLVRASLSSESLEIYKNWFIQNPVETKNRKVFRVIEKDKAQNNLNWIKDINEKEFSEILKNQNSCSCKESLYSTKKNYFTEHNENYISKKIYEYITESDENEKWKHQLFPLDFAALKHNPENTVILDKINKEYKKIMEKILNILK